MELYSLISDLVLPEMVKVGVFLPKEVNNS